MRYPHNLWVPARTRPQAPTTSSSSRWCSPPPPPTPVGSPKQGNDRVGYQRVGSSRQGGRGKGGGRGQEGAGAGVLPARMQHEPHHGRPEHQGRGGPGSSVTGSHDGDPGTARQGKEVVQQVKALVDTRAQGPEKSPGESPTGQEDKGYEPGAGGQATAPAGNPEGEKGLLESIPPGEQWQGRLDSGRLNSPAHRQSWSGAHTGRRISSGGALRP